MSSLPRPTGPVDDTTEVPWFAARPPVTVAVVVLLFAGVLALRLSVSGADEAVTLLYSLPIALAAVAFGLRGGLTTGLAAVVLVAVWAVLADVDLSLVGWASRVVPLLLLGSLLGDATDRVRRADDERRAIAVAAERHRDAVEINDSVVQGMAAAKWSLEAGDLDGGLRTLGETMRTARALVSDLLRQADMGPGGHRGDVNG